MQTSQPEPALGAAGEGVRQEQLEHLVHDAAAAGGGLQPVAQLGVTVPAGRRSPNSCTLPSARSVRRSAMHQCRSSAASIAARRFASQVGNSAGVGWAPGGMNGRLASSGCSSGPGVSSSRHGRSRTCAPSSTAGTRGSDACGLPVGRGEQLEQRGIGRGPVVVGHHRVLGADAGEPGPSQRPCGGHVVAVGAGLEPVQAQTPGAGVGEGVPTSSSRASATAPRPRPSGRSQ